MRCCALLHSALNSWPCASVCTFPQSSYLRWDEECDLTCESRPKPAVRQKSLFFFFKGWNCRLTQSRLVNNRSRMLILILLFFSLTQGRAHFEELIWISTLLCFYRLRFSLSLLVHFSVCDKTLQPHYRISIKSHALACKQCCLCLFPASKSAHFLSPRSRDFPAFSGLVDISQNGFDLTSAGRKKKERNKTTLKEEHLH